MAKSGQRPAYDKIIDRPELRSPIRRFLEGSITLALWAIWLYWLLPLITLCAWIFGLHHYVSHIVSESSLVEISRVLQKGGFGMLVITFIMGVWIFYNIRIISKNKGCRRKQVHMNTDDKTAQNFAIDRTMLRKVKNARKIDINIKDNKIHICI